LAMTISAPKTSDMLGNTAAIICIAIITLTSPAETAHKPPLTAKVFISEKAIVITKKTLFFLIIHCQKMTVIEPTHTHIIDFSREKKVQKAKVTTLKQL